MEDIKVIAHQYALQQVKMAIPGKPNNKEKVALKAVAHDFTQGFIACDALAAEAGNPATIAEEADQMKAYVNKLFMAALSTESSDFKDFIEDFAGTNEFKKILPFIDPDELDIRGLGEWEEFLSGLHRHGKMGFYAECYQPECSNFRFKKGKPVSWSVHMGISELFYVYADTFPELLATIKAVSDRKFKEAWSKQIKKAKQTN